MVPALPFARAMFRYEAGQESPLSDEQIKYGFRLARGDEPSEPPETPDTPSVENDAIARLCSRSFVFSSRSRPCPKPQSKVGIVRHALRH
jgi:hypothetical protein